MKRFPFFFFGGKIRRKMGQVSYAQIMVFIKIRLFTFGYGWGIIQR